METSEMNADITEGQNGKGGVQDCKRDHGEGKGGGKVCGVCGDKALAHNFGALTCETCKAFFRRNALKQETQRCMFGNNCTIDKTTRRLCAACRLKKCFAIGMKPQLILDDEAKKARMTLRQKKRAEREGASQPDPGSAVTVSTSCLSDHTVPVSGSSADVHMADDDSSSSEAASSFSSSGLADLSASSHGTRAKGTIVCAEGTDNGPFCASSLRSPFDTCTVRSALDLVGPVSNVEVSSGGMASSQSVSYHSGVGMPHTDAMMASPNTHLTSMSPYPNSTAFSPDTSTQSPPGMGYSAGSAMPFQGPANPNPDVLAAVDLFFQQSLAGSEPRSQDMLSGAPVAVELWATPSVATQSWGTGWSLPKTPTSQQKTFAAPQEGAGPWHPSPCQEAPTTSSHDVQQPCFGNFHHVLREQLPSDMKMYWPLTKEERATFTLISSTYQDTLMTLADRDPERATAREADLSSSKEISMQDYFYVLDQVLHCCVRFAKALPDFRQLKQSDQIALLKASSMQCYGIALSAMIIPERGIWPTAFGDVGANHLPPAINDDAFVMDVFQFCANLKSIAKTDLTVYGLLHCILLFEPRESRLEDKTLVNTLKDKYLILLKHYLESEFSYVHADIYFGALMEGLGRLRMIGVQAVAFYRRFSNFFTPLGAEFYVQD